MESDDNDDKGALNISAVNSVILDYYKKFGRKRDLEQYFSLSTAQGEIRDPTGRFWKNMKTQSDSSDSGGKKSDSSQELCRISIKCSVPALPNLQDDHTKNRIETISPPIITEDIPVDISRPPSRFSGEGSSQSGDENSQKSMDVLLDSSTNKLLSPSSSVTSQRKLEWDSLADVGYANESGRKTSASSLSTLERLALKQQYSNNETEQDLYTPTAHSTPFDENPVISKSTKGGRKFTKMYKKDVDTVEVNMPQNSDKVSHGINVHLTKHISFSVDKHGELTVETMKKNPNKSPPKIQVVNEMSPLVKIDKEIQTTLLKSKENPIIEIKECIQKPSILNINTLRKKNRRKRLRLTPKKVRNKKSLSKQKVSRRIQENIVDQLSEAESFEYMPGHIYNENKLKLNLPLQNKVTSNKSSLESSDILTTDSSKGSKHSFTKDLEKSIDLLKAALKQRYDDNLKKKLVKEIIQRLLQSKYRDDESTTDFLSGLSFGSKKLGMQSSNSSTHTSGDSNDTVENKKNPKPKKSILRMDKFNANIISSTSQSAPNLPFASCSDIPVASKLMKQLTPLNTDSDMSGKEKVSSGLIFAKTSSEELYCKYLEALRREEAYKKHLKDKDTFLKQTLTNSDSAFNIPKKKDREINNKLKDLMNDLIRNNYDDGSGDASKLEGGSCTNMSYNESNNKKHRSHSVFTLSSCNSDNQNRKHNLKKQLQNEVNDLSKPGSSREKSHYCCCPHHLISKDVVLADSSVQVNVNDVTELSTNNQNIDASLAKRYSHCDIQSNQNIAQIVSDHVTGDIKYVCLCNEKVSSQDVCDNFLIYKCCRVTNKSVQSNEISKLKTDSGDKNPRNNHLSKTIESESPAFIRSKHKDAKNVIIPENVTVNDLCLLKATKSSQTNMLLNMLGTKPSDRSIGSTNSDFKKDPKSLNSLKSGSGCSGRKVLVHEVTRCIQTEISINPQISDPSLPDIVIINDTESVKVISENVREVVRDCSGVDICNKVCINEIDITSNHTKCNKFVCSEENMKVACEIDVQTEPKGDIYSSELNLNNSARFDINDVNNTQFITDNFTIPIQGTNMKLVVSIGSNDLKQKSLSKDEFLNSCGDLMEKTPCLQKSTVEKSSKSIQYVEDLRSVHDIDFTNTNHNKGHINIVVNDKVQGNDRSQQIDKISDCISISKHNTCLMNDKNTLLCSANEINNMDAFTQTINDVYKKNAMTQNDQYLEDVDVAPQTNSSKMSENIVEHIEINNNENIIDTPKEDKKNVDTQSDDVQPNRSVNTKIKSQSTHDKKNSISSIHSSEIQFNNPKISYISKEQQKKSPLSLVTQSVVSSDIDDNKTCKKSVENNDIQFIIDASKRSNENIGSVDTKIKDPQVSYQPKLQKKISPVFLKIQSLVSSDIDDNTTSKSSPKRSNENFDKSDIQINDPKMSYKPEGQVKKSPILLKSQSIDNSDMSVNTTSNISIENNNKQFISDATKTNKGNTDKFEMQINDQQMSYRPKKQMKKTSISLKKQSVVSSDIDENTTSKSSVEKNNKQFISDASKSNKETETYFGKDPILDIIKDITERYSKNDVQKNKRKKCFKEIITVLNYLLETDESTDHNPGKSSYSCSSDNNIELSKKPPETKSESCQTTNQEDKGIQISAKKSKNKFCNTDSSDLHTSTDLPATSSDTATCKVLNRIKKECEKYHQKRCNSHRAGKKCELSSSTSANCDHCKKIHHCPCRFHKCKTLKSRSNGNKTQKKSVAYNLIIQTSESMISEETVCNNNRHPLKNIIVKVPSRRNMDYVPFRELEKKIEKKMSHVGLQCDVKTLRSRSCPDGSEISSTDDCVKRSEDCTVREYLEINRPDFIEKCIQRQDCLKDINQTRDPCSPRLKMVVIHTPNCMGTVASCNMYCGGVPMSYSTCLDPCKQNVPSEVTRIANERAFNRELLSTRVDPESPLNALTIDELRHLAREIGVDVSQKKHKPKFLSERDMKKHSENIYKSLPEVTRKKEEVRKENIKKTNLLMANIFKKNLQKKALRGSVNLSNYSTVIKI